MQVPCVFCIHLRSMGRMEMFTALLPSPYALLALLLVLVAAVIRQKVTRRDGQASCLPPGPRKLPIIGSLHHLVSGSEQPHRRLWELAKKHGPVMHLQLGQISTVVVSSADAAREILKTHDLVFSDRPQILAPRILANGCRDVAFAPYGDYWRTTKKMCTLELLSAKRVRSYRRIREEEVDNLVRFVSQVPARSAINLSERFSALTNSISSRAAFGTKSKYQKRVIELMNNLVRLSSGLSIVDLFPSLEFVATGTKTKLKELKCHVDDVLGEIIQEHRYTRSAGGRNVIDNHPERGEVDEDDDLLDQLLGHLEHQDLDFPLSISDVKAIITDMYTAGTDTSASTLEWAMAELIRNPKVMLKLQFEVRNAFEQSGKMDEIVIRELSYLKLVIKETLRLHPPAPLLLPRECRETCHILGYLIPIKTRVLVNAWALGRDPHRWLNPEIFEPERFQDGVIDFRGANFEYVPFGAGRRICPGITFGLAVVELALAKLLCYFDWDTLDGVNPTSLDLTEIFGATIHKKVPLHLMATAKFPLSLKTSSC